MIEWAGTAFTIGKAIYGYIKDGKEFYDDAKDVFGAGKDIKEHFEIKEGEPKFVDMSWLENSGFGDRLKTEGYDIRWSRPDKIASWELLGYSVMHEIDKSTRTKRRLVVYDGLTLIGKKT